MACQGQGNSYNADADADAGGQMKRDDEHVINTQEPNAYFLQSQPQMYQPINLQSQSYDGQDTNFLNQTGEQVKTLANGDTYLAQGAASGAANLAQGAAQAVKTTFGINSSAAAANSRSNLPTTMNKLPTTKQ